MNKLLANYNNDYILFIFMLVIKSHQEEKGNSA